MKKILIISTAIIALFAATYTGVWFFNKAKIETTIANSAKTFKQEPQIDYINYKLNIGCFPYLCAELSNIQIGMKKQFKLEALKETKIIYKIKNIFNPQLNFSKQQAEYDIFITNTPAKFTTNLIANFDSLNLTADKNNFNLAFNNATVEGSSADSAFTSLANVDNFKLSINKAKKDNKHFIGFGYNLANFKLFGDAGKQPTLNIIHSTFSGGFANVSEKVYKNNKNITDSKSFMINNIQDFIQNKTTLQVNDFKLATKNMQVGFKGTADITKDQFINVNADSFIKFNSEGNILEQMLKLYRIGKNEDGVYYINLRTQETQTTINKDIKLNALKII